MNNGDKPKEPIFRLVYSSDKPKNDLTFTPGDKLGEKAETHSSVEQRGPSAQEIADDIRRERRELRATKEKHQQAYERLMRDLRENTEAIKGEILEKIGQGHSELFVCVKGSSLFEMGKTLIPKAEEFLEPAARVLNQAELIRAVQNWIQRSRPFGEYAIKVESEKNPTEFPDIWLTWESIIKRK